MTNDSTKVEVEYDSELDFPDLLERYRLTQGDKIALIQGEQTRSYAAMIKRIYGMANGLLALGVKPGDRVAMLSRNSMAYSEMFAATLLAGATAVPLQSMVTADTLRLMLRDSSARVLVLSSEFTHMAEGFLRDQDSVLPGGLLGFDFTDDRFNDLELWLQQQSVEAPGVAIDPAGEFNIIYSSGTTGVPKGIVHNHSTRQALVKGLLQMGIDGESMTLITTPLYSNTTITTWWPTLCAGGTMVLVSKFAAAEALALVDRWSISHAMFVPVQYDRMMNLKNFARYDLSSLQMVFCTSAPLRSALKKQIIENLPGELIEFYGLTEGGVGTLFIGSIAYEQGKLGSVGPPIPGSTLKTIDEKGNELGHGQTGEIVGRSGSMSDGYLNRDDANAEMFWYDADGTLFYRSGDVGYLDVDGWLYLSDRKKDMIISGGFNIYATDIELVVLEHSAVHEVAVVALPSREWGETPLAIVVLEEGVTESEEALRSWANERLGKAQRISQLVFIDELPKSSIGKVLKRQLRETYAELAK
ncbi:MAG: AMP-binding protein [Halioglobus sp.]